MTDHPYYATIYYTALSTEVLETRLNHHLRRQSGVLEGPSDIWTPP